MLVVNRLLARVCLWCYVLQYACVVVNAGCAITPDGNGRVDIPSGWTTIGERAFYLCTSLTSVTIPDSVTTIGTYAFAASRSLASVTIPDSVTTIGAYAFSGCTSLASITIPDSVTTIGSGAFQRCSSLTSVTIPDSVTYFGQSDVDDDRMSDGSGKTFSHCTNLASVTIGNGVTFIDEQTFSYCTSLTSVTIPDSVTAIGRNAFSSCTGLTSVTILDSVTTIGYYAFETCTGLVSVSIPDSVTTIDGGAFRGCTSLASVTIPESVIIIDATLFAECSSLQNMTFRTSSSITFSIGALDSKPKLQSMVFKDTITSIKGLPLFLIGQYQCKEDEPCGCQNGYGNYLGSSMPEYFNCLPCRPGSSSDGTQSACSPCKRGTYTESSAIAVCTPCDPGTYSTVQGASSNTTCGKCRRGTYAPAPGSDKCIDCPPGSFCNETGLSIYKECSVGRYTDVKSRWNCTTCPAGRYQNKNGTAKCTECDAGTSNNNTGSVDISTCLNCEAGRYAPQKGSGACQLCGKDTFTGSAGKHTNCTDCPSGKTTLGQGTDKGGTGATKCVKEDVPCAPGERKVAEQDGGECEKCDMGYYSPSGDSCLPCEKGAYGAEEGSTSCTPCPPGRYGAEQAGAGLEDTCEECAEGMFVNIQGATECFDCPPGSACGEKGLNMSVACVAGRYTDTDRRQSCTMCPAGRYQMNDGAARCTECVAGTSSNKTGSVNITDCTVCEAGEYAPQQGSQTCQLCGKDTFTALAGKHTECDYCSSGKTTAGVGVDEGATGATRCVEAVVPCDAGEHRVKKGGECVECEAGYYSPSGSRCLFCPPGSFCPTKGMDSPKECPVGHYTDTKLRQNCTACPAGEYQPINGSAKCFSCPMGTFLEEEGAISSVQCTPCSAGTYGDKKGLPQCSPCPTGQVQPAQGKDSCTDCTLEGKIKTNNEAHTLCIDNKALLSSSVMESMFTKGVGLSLSFGMAGLFVGLAGAIHFMKSGYSATVEEEYRLGALGPPQVVLKSALPGFSFGSEVVLILGMIMEAPWLGWALLAFRLLHPCTMIVLTVGMFAPNSAPVSVQKMMRKSPLNKEFSRRKVPLLCMLYLTSACDVTMLQLMPWVDSEFYTESMGYPSLHLMLVCMVVKTLQSLASVICQGIFLLKKVNLNDPLLTLQAKILFGFSITLSGVSLVMGVMTLLAKWSLLGDLNEKDTQGEGQTKSTRRTSASAAVMEMGDLYANNITGEEGRGSTSFHNPMHAAAMTENISLKEELKAKDNGMQAIDVVLEEQKREIEQLRLQEQPVLNL